MQEQHYNPETEKNKSELWNLSIKDLFFKYVRFLPLIALSVAIALIGAFTYLRYTVPVYSAGGSMLIKSEDKNARANNPMTEILEGSKPQSITSEIEILKSKPLMQRVVNRLGVNWTYIAVGKIKSVNIYKASPVTVEPVGELDSLRSFTLKIKTTGANEFKVNDDPAVYRFSQSFKTSNGTFKLIKSGEFSSGTSFKISWVPVLNAAQAYAGALQVMPKAPGTGIVNISMLTPNPALGADIINTLMEEYSAYSVEQKKVSSEKKLGFIYSRLEEIGGKLDSTQRVLLDFQMRNGFIDAESQTSSNFDVLAEADKAIVTERLRLNVSGMIDSYLADKRNVYEKVVVPSSLGLEDVTLNEMVSQYNKNQILRKQYIDGNTPVAHPLVKELDAQTEKLRLSIRESLRNIRMASESIVSEYRNRSNISQGQLRAMPEKVKEFNKIKENVELYAGLYKLFSTEKENTELQMAATISDSGIIDKAMPRTTPVKPNKKAIRIMAVLLGLLLPALFIFVSEVLNDKVSTRFDVEKITNAPILGEIGHSYSDSTLVVSKNTRSMIAEQFRIIRSNLQYVLKEKEKVTILVTSSFSGEGKSYISTNIGAAISLAGKKTVVLEFDIRKPKILSGLGLPKGPGLTNFLVGKSKNLAELIRPVGEYDNLFVLGCGPVPPNPSELLLDPKVDEMFAWLKENFDVVIIDTAPVGMVSDAMTLGKYADASLYLVRQGHTFKKQIIFVDEYYRENKLPKLSVIINDVKLRAGYGYYGYGRYGYGYGYGYGSYYEEEVPPKNMLDRVLDKLDISRFFRKKKKGS